jgi:hypothetical protein
LYVLKVCPISGTLIGDSLETVINERVLMFILDDDPITYTFYIVRGGWGGGGGSGGHLAYKKSIK